METNHKRLSMKNEILHDGKTMKLNEGRVLGFAEYGAPKGFPVFYFHGFPGSRLEAGLFHKTAEDHDCRLIGIDRPGMGLSSFHKKRSLISWATDLTHFADYLGIEKFSIVGHSGGAPFVAACAYVLPHRLKSIAVVSGMAPFEIPEARIGMARGQIIANTCVKAMPGLASVMMRLTRFMLKKPNKMITQMLKQLPEVDQVIFRDPNSRKAIINSTLEAFRNGIAGPAQEMSLLLNPWGFKLEDIHCPTTIWHGRLDTQVPLSHANIYANLIPHAQLNIFDNEGHHSLIRNYSEKILKSVCI